MMSSTSAASSQKAASWFLQDVCVYRRHTSITQHPLRQSPLRCEQALAPTTHLLSATSSSATMLFMDLQ
jgi:hypothetical protein